MKIQNKIFAKRMTELCEQKNITYHQLAQRSGLEYRRVYRIACGAHENPGLYTVMRVCKGLDVSIDEFVNTEEFQSMIE